MISPPSIGSDGCAMLRSIYLQGNNAPAADISDCPLLLRLVAAGHIRRQGPGYSRLTVTGKGQALLSAMMRCE